MAAGTDTTIQLCAGSRKHSHDDAATTVAVRELAPAWFALAVPWPASRTSTRFGGHCVLTRGRSTAIVVTGAVVPFVIAFGGGGLLMALRKPWTKGLGLGADDRLGADIDCHRRHLHGCQPFDVQRVVMAGMEPRGDRIHRYVNAHRSAPFKRGRSWAGSDWRRRAQNLLSIPN